MQRNLPDFRAEIKVWNPVTSLAVMVFSVSKLKLNVSSRKHFGRFYSALQKLNTPQTTRTAQIISFIERVRLPLDCILLEGCGGTTFTETAQVVWVSLQHAPVLC